MDHKNLDEIYRPPEAELFSPGVLAEHETRVVSVFKESWGIFRERFALIAGIYLLVWLVPDQCISYLDSRWYNTGAFFHDFKGSLNLWRLVNSFIGIIAAGAIIQSTVWHLRGRKEIRMRDAFRSSFRNWGSIWLARFLAGSIVIAGLIVPALMYLMIGGRLWRGSHSPWVIAGVVFGVILLLLFILYFYLRLLFSMYLVVGGNRTGLAACQESWQLTKGRLSLLFFHWGALLMFWLIPSLIFFLILGLFGAAKVFDSFVINGVVESIFGLGIAFSFVHYTVLLEKLLKLSSSANK